MRRSLLFVTSLMMSSFGSFVYAKPPVNTPPKVTISVDATDAPRKIFHAKLNIEAAPGPLTLYYPKWLPGEHAPTGPLVDLAGLKFSAAGQPITWHRDLVDMFAIHLDVPAGANSVDAQLDYLSPAVAEGFSSGASATEKLALISWNQLLLYPKGWNASQIMFTPSLRLPAGWKYGTSLTVSGEQGDSLQFAPLSLEMLVDSPVLAGQYFRRIPLQETEPKAWLDIAADSAAALEITPEQTQHVRNLVAETGAMFGAQHYLHYNFLLTLSDHTAHFGLEHHQSSDDRISERSLIDSDLRELTAGLLPHEMTHSWNGKYRRPAGLATPNYQQPMIGELLWVYEGLTQYLGQVFTARSGLLTPELYREELANTAADMDRGRPGRTWRPLEDTAVDAQDLYGSPTAWVSWRRTVDYYPEGELLWLDVDTTIRQQSHGQKSINDFARAFYGPPSGAPQVVPYNFDQLVAALNQVQPNDWRGFLTTRLQSTSARAPLGGIVNGGWNVVYNDTEPEITSAAEKARHYADFRWSLGITVNGENDAIPDTIVGMPAAEAGVGPGMIMVAVNGRKYTADILHEALKAAKSNNQPIQLLIRNGDYYRTFNINYRGGDMYPHLVRDASKPDLLSDIIKPLAAR